ncbi:MAG: DUF2805 domain-containing protein [Moraxellaceae bacterium]|nr:DUF2805 domain-containing protein [Moraxellaceae bacterium]
MRQQLKSSSFKMWRKRVAGRKTSILDLRGYRLFVHTPTVLNSLMFTKRANCGAMRKS